MIATLNPQQKQRLNYAEALTLEQLQTAARLAVHPLFASPTLQPSRSDIAAIALVLAANYQSMIHGQGNT